MWSSVRQFLPEFPQVECIAPQDLDFGVQVGGCIFGKKLGRGAFGAVYFVRNQSLGQDEAVKAIRKADLDSVEHIRRVQTEVSTLGKLSHPNIALLHSFTHTSTFLLIHMEYAGQRNLHFAIDEAGGRLSGEASQAIVVQMAQALAHCHAKGVAHGDVKPENIALADDSLRVKLIDFGHGAKIGAPCHGFRGTMPFMAPEVLSGGQYEPASTDIWSTGVTMLEMLCGIGAMNRIMGWESRVQPHPRFQQELVRFFTHPEALTNCLESEHVITSCDLIETLHGVCQCLPAQRWTAMQLISCGWLSSSLD
jgi:serine/threonine protein kinase